MDNLERLDWRAWSVDCVFFAFEKKIAQIRFAIIRIKRLIPKQIARIVVRVIGVRSREAALTGGSRLVDLDQFRIIADAG